LAVTPVRRIGRYTRWRKLNPGTVATFYTKGIAISICYARFRIYSDCVVRKRAAKGIGQA